MRVHRVVAAGLVTVVGVFAGPPAAAYASAELPDTLTVPAKRPASGPLTAPVTPAVPAGAGCDSVRQELQKPAARGGSSVLCISDVSAATPRPQVRSASAATWCDDLDSEQWYANRTEACLHGHVVTYSVIERPSGAVTGTATFSVSQEIELSATGTVIDDFASVKLTASTGKLAAPNATFSATCSAPCVTSDGAGFTNETFTLNEVQDAFFTYTDTPSTQDTFRLSYRFSVVPPAGTVPVNAALTWGGPADIRCDKLVGASPGCVFPGYQPTLELPVATFGAGAMTVLFAQVYLPDEWGYASPLHREANEAKADANRNAICDSTWVSDPTVPNDSCDEYAFAATKESGGNLGLRGSDCAEVKIAKNASGQWVPTAYKYNGTERCLRAHVPNLENTAVGGELGRFTVAQRLLDNDAYLVEVY